MNLLPKPIRLLDTRTLPGGAKLAAGDTYNLQATGVVVGGTQVPAGAVGVLGNVAVVATVNSGYLSLFPQGSPPSPVTAGINWFATSQILKPPAWRASTPRTGRSASTTAWPAAPTPPT